MDLYSGIPWWIVKNRLVDYYNPLRNDIETDVAIIGSGITGSLVADEMCRAGIECCVIDKRSVSTGSSCASTALLQYEIDLPLFKMAEMMKEEDAVLAYRSCLESIEYLRRILEQAGVNAGFERVPSTFYASNFKGLRLIKSEYEMRKKHGFPCEYLTRRALRERIGIKAPGALYNNVSAQVDTYKAATGLLSHNMRHHKLDVFTHTEITEWNRANDGYVLRTDRGPSVKCRYVVVAAGFEASPFLPEKLMELTSTFAVISSPVDKKYLWPGKSLIWETGDPYLYIRTSGSRIIVGGEDIRFKNPSLRKFLLDRKSEVLEKKFRKLFPGIPFETEISWAGTFSSTKDALPIIGPTSDNPRMLYALGYGGNGITFSVIAAHILTRTVQGGTDGRSHVFSPERESLK